ncbi:hypothetical protein JXA63_00485 [Candidatus Woesebacteria bacterium]|nr:hypothetical protein [Candidatus Woesebacteria bacterium]
MDKEWTPKINCIAYSAVEEASGTYTQEDRDNFILRGIPMPQFPTVNEVWASCCHPDREGYQEPNGQLGCVMVDFDTGELIEGANCVYQTLHDSEEAMELGRRIDLAFQRHEPSPNNF